MAMKPSGVQEMKRKSSFSIDSIIADSRRSTTETRCISRAESPNYDTRGTYAPPTTQLSRSIPVTDVRVREGPSLPARRTGVVAYDERQQRSLFDYASRYNPGYDQALMAQFAAAAAAMATMTSSTDRSAARAAAADPLSYAYWMQAANRQHPSPALFLPGKHCYSHRSSNWLRFYKKHSLYAIRFYLSIFYTGWVKMTTRHTFSI